MKICYCNPTTLMKRPISQISEKLASKHDVTVFTPREGREREASLHHSDLENVQVDTYPIYTPPLESEWGIPGLEFYKKAWHHVHQHDVVHMWVPFYISHTVLAVYTLFTDTDQILTMDTIPGYSFSMGTVMDWLFTIYYSTLGKLAFATADTITLYGESMKPFADQAGVPMDKVEITPTGIDIEVKEQDTDVRDEFDIQAEDTMALFVGITVRRKGVGILLDVAEMLQDQPFTFVIVGDSAKHEQYTKKAEAMELDNVVFTGFRKDVHNFYHAADVFFFPSRGEGLAGVIMEAMVYEVPIISSKIPCTTDLIDDGESGYLCPVEDVECYVEKIRSLDEDTKETFTASAKERIKEYRWDKRLERFEALYD